MTMLDLEPQVGSLDLPRWIGEPDARASLFKKMAATMGEIEAMSREGSADVETKTGGSYNYRYLTESQILGAIRHKLAEKNVAVFVSVDDAEDTKDGLTRVRLSATFCDGDTGAMMVVHSMGQGQDKGDKALYKAITGGNRYLFWKTFLIETEDDEPNKSNDSREKLAQGLISDGKQRLIYARAKDCGVTKDGQVDKDKLSTIIAMVTGQNEVKGIKNVELDRILKTLDGYKADPEKAEGAITRFLAVPQETDAK